MKIQIDTDTGIFYAQGKATLTQLYLALDTLTNFVEDAENEINFERKWQEVITNYNKSS